MSLSWMFDKNAVLLVRVGEDEADGSMRVYLDARWRGLHTHVSDPEGKRKVRAAWFGGGGHTIINVPPEHRCNCPEPVADVLEALGPAPFARVAIVCGRCGAQLVQEADAEGWTAATEHDCAAGTWEVVETK